jgi:CheY-like chemotaxis protein
MRTQTILLVEDKGPVRSVLQETLTELGYAVLEAANGEVALELAQTHEGPIDLLLSDIVMPGMHGNEVARRFRAIRPETRVILMSGYTSKAVAKNIVSASGAGFIAKPFSLAELTNSLRSALGDDAG